MDHLYIGRILAGATGGGMYICIPLFVAEIADQRYLSQFFFSWNKVTQQKRNQRSCMFAQGEKDTGYIAVPPLLSTQLLLLCAVRYESSKKPAII